MRTQILTFIPRGEKLRHQNVKPDVRWVELLPCSLYGPRFTPASSLGGEQAVWGNLSSTCFALGMCWGQAFWVWLSFMSSRWHSAVLMVKSGGECVQRQLLYLFIFREYLQEGMPCRNVVSSEVHRCILRMQSFMPPVPVQILWKAE